MEGNRKGQNLLIIALVVAVVAMSVGFAASSYTQNLNINGSVTAKAAKWDIHYDSNSYSETSGTGYVASSTHSLNSTTLEYTVTLEPGQTFEATANVVNAGTFDANLKGITLSGVSATQAKYIKYSIFYNGTEYTATNNSITGVTLAKATGNTNTTVPVKVKVEYFLPEEATDLPTSDQTLTLTSTLSFEQAA